MVLWIRIGTLRSSGVRCLTTTAARQRFLWWPFHPLGFPVSLLFGTVFFSVFLAWLIKIIALKYGGPRTYALTRPFFIGVVVGQFLAAGLWLVVDGFTGMVGNRTPVY